MSNPTIRINKARIPLIVTLAVIGLLVVGFFFFAGVYADILWFNQLGFLNVLTTQWIAVGVMFLIGFFAMALPIWLSLELAYRNRPVYAKLNDQLNHYQELIAPLRRLATFGIPIGFGVLAGMTAVANWRTALLWLNSSPTGKVDAQFGLDISFYLLQLPFYNNVVAFLTTTVLIAGILTIAVGYIYGSVRIQGRQLVVAKSARIQVAVLAALYLLLLAAGFWLDQYNTMTESSSGLMYGPSYADVNAKIPGLTILAGIAGLVALLLLVTAVTGKWLVSVVGAALLIISSLLVGTAYPLIVQRLQVVPSERSLEAEYLSKNIEATRFAFGVNDLVEEPYSAITEAEPGALRSDAETTTNIRIIDPALISDTFRQEQQNKQYYQFPGALDVDRYSIDGKVQDAVIAVRELNQAGLGESQSWVNNVLIYTHGYGVVAAYGNKRTSDGLPDFMESGIPSSGVLGEYEERVYFGEYSPTYSIVGAEKGSSPVELDYPTSESGESAAKYTFTGDGGPKLDNWFNRLVYALKFQSEQILFSQDVTNASQILYDRDPALRVSKVAPYLTLDSDPYPSVVDGKIVWIIDAYTTSNNYPYAQQQNVAEAITDTYTNANSLAAKQGINYIRNSVKAVVDAYDGSVTLYVWDETDPILQAWNKVFPNTLTPMSKMSADLMSHVRYPSDLFKIQRKVLSTYHVTNAESYYSRDDAWITPNEPTAASAKTARLQPPYYLTMKLPGDDESAFSLYSTYIPDAQGAGSRSVLTGYLAVNSDAGGTAGVKSDSYGKITLLTLPKDNTVDGPGQMQSNFNTNTTVANELNLLEEGGRTQVIRANLLTLPVGGGLLYVQPVYIKATGETSYPLIRKVLVGFGNEIAFENTLDEALDVLFGGDSGVDVPDEVSPTEPTKPTNPTDPTTPSTPTNPGKYSPELWAALQEARAALTERDTAMQKGDWAAYGVADQKMQKALERALSLSE